MNFFDYSSISQQLLLVFEQPKKRVSLLLELSNEYLVAAQVTRMVDDLAQMWAEPAKFKAAIADSKLSAATIVAAFKAFVKNLSYHSCELHE